MSPEKPPLSTTGASVTDHALWMARALDLARHGEAHASPNPMVGAVVVRGGLDAGEGFHNYSDPRHAEIVALDASGDAARGATLYVNLEPCCITGRTGPCTLAIAAAGIRRVVAAMADPNPAVAGRGFDELRANGIEVSVGEAEDDARRLNEAFAVWIRTKRPLVTLKSAITLDGQAGLAPSVKSGGKRVVGGDPADRANRWITSEESRAEVQRMRHASDALLTGIGTVLADDPALTDRSGLARRRKLLRVVLDAKLRLPARSKLARTAEGDVLVFTAMPEKSAQTRRLRAAGVEVVRVAARRERIDLHAVLDELGRRGILSVLLEAGPTLNRAALEAEIVDKMRLFVAPRFAGSAPRLPAFGGWSAARPLADVSVRRFGPDASIEGYLRDVYGNR
ncbi:MAG: bifunctional diaminohydroxyphosphoribosylaminopyrimidine deaminase/5-amino-6-(5-phosphoribosylamino)uracil reductase RibD [Candidatus Acidiferrales bacterium]